MKLSFHGAAKQVTGSMYLLQTEDGYKILVDCGLSYEKNQSFNENLEFPFVPSEIDVVILTHAHIDHSGNLPTLVKQGFEGNIICTPPTAKLTQGLLDDSASIQSLQRKKNKGKDKRLYGYKEVKDAVDQILTLPFYRKFSLTSTISIELIEAGHILGAASVIIELLEEGKIKRIGFSGDLGPDNSAIIVAPVPMTNLDYLVCESTYGNRLHKDTSGADDLLLKHILSTCIDNPGRLIIPAFSIGRTQAILFTLNQLYRQNRLPNLRIINDSPLAILGSKLHDEFSEYLNEEAKAFYNKYQSLFEFKQLSTIEDEEDEELLKDHLTASVIVSSAGMLEGGRIQQHVSNNLQNPFCTILIAGFCAPGTLGHDLLQNKGTLRIKGNVRDVYASVKSTDVFSAHPDKEGLIKYIKAVANTSHLRKIFLVHGDDESLVAFGNTLENEKLAQIEIPEKGDIYLL